MSSRTDSRRLNDETDVPVEVTTKKELTGWYCFDWANSVFSGVAMSGFLPLLLKRSAQLNAGFPLACPNLVSDLAMVQDVFNDTAVEFMYRVNSNATLVDECSGNLLCDQGYCRGQPSLTTECLSADASEIVALDVNFMGIMLDPTSYATGLISASVVFQLICFLSTSALADYGNLRKKAMMFFSLSGSICTMLFYFVTSDMYWLGAILVLLANAGYGTSIVFYNSYLPLLATNTEEVVAAPLAMKLEVRGKVEDKISSYGFLSGYLSTVILLAICVPIAFAVPDVLLGYKLNIVLSGAWWFLFSFYTFAALRDRPGPSLPAGSNYITHGWVSAWKTLTTTRAKLKTSYRFLVCWFFFSDGFSLIASIGALYASEEVDWGCFPKSLGVSLMFLLVPLMAAIGGYFYEKVFRQWLNIPNKNIILINLSVFIIMSMYGCLGFVFEDIGIKKGWEIVIFGAIYGFNLGSIQSYSRALFSSLIPKGMEAQLFGFFEVTDKGSSWLGPAIAGLIKQYTRNLRYTFFYMIIVLAIPSFFLYKLDIAKGMQEAEDFHYNETEGTEVVNIINPTSSLSSSSTAGEVKVEIKGDSA